MKKIRRNPWATREKENVLQFFTSGRQKHLLLQNRQYGVFQHQNAVFQRLSGGSQKNGGLWEGNFMRYSGGASHEAAERRYIIHPRATRAVFNLP